MHSYELTERGKIIVAILLVLLLLLVPSAILALKAMAQPAAPPANQDSGYSETLLPEILPPAADSPPPNGGGFNPTYVLPSNNNVALNEGEEALPGVQPTDQPAAPGQPIVDPSGGTLSFFFAPELQNTLDAETLSMLGVFMDSPKNSQDTLIAVEMPRLPEDDQNKLISAVVSAFAAHGVGEQRLAYIVNSSAASGGVFEVKLSYIPAPVK